MANISNPSCIPNIIGRDDNDLIAQIPDDKEIEENLHDMNIDSVVSTDEFINVFFVKCWSIIKGYVIDAVKVFLGGVAFLNFFRQP